GKPVRLAAARRRQVEKKVAQPSWLWGQRASCPLIRSVFGVPPKRTSLWGQPRQLSGLIFSGERRQLACGRVQAGSLRSPDEYSPRSPESLRYFKLKR